MGNDKGKIALVTVSTGQDGAYLAECLLNRGYTVYGTFRRTSSVNFWRIASLGILEHPQLHLVEHDLTDGGAGFRLLERTQATEVYNLAAHRFVGLSFDQLVTTAVSTRDCSVRVVRSPGRTCFCAGFWLYRPRGRGEWPA